MTNYPTAQSTAAPKSLPSSVQPVIPGFYPDPTICRSGGVYFLANSSFEYTPGVPLWRSEDLVTWEQVGNILDREDLFPAGRNQASRGVYAPTLRFHDNLFWMITTNVDVGNRGQLLVTAQDPAGPWSAAVHLRDVSGIDPDIAWDDDGRCLVTYCMVTPAGVGIGQVEVDPHTGEVLEEPRSVWSGIGLQHPEAPHLYRRGEWWYLLIAEGGTERGHAVSVARSHDPRGPFVGAPHNPILSHRSMAHPVQNTGHADLVECSDGSWVMVYLAVRPRGVTPGFHVNGRETFLAAIDWIDAWPVVREDDFDVPAQSLEFEDTFVDDTIHPRWVSSGERIDTFVARHPDQGLVVSPATARVGRPSVLVVRCQDPWWRAQATFDLGTGAIAALHLRLDDTLWCEVQASATEARAVLAVAGHEVDLGVVAHDRSGPLTVQIAAVQPTHDGPDDVVLSVLTDAGLREIGRFDGRYLSTEVAGGFTGRVVGVRAIERPVRVMRFSYAPIPVP